MPSQMHQNKVLWLPASLALFAALSLCGQAQIATSSPASHASAAPPTASYVAPPTGAVAPRTGPVAAPTAPFTGAPINSASNYFPHSGDGHHAPTGQHQHRPSNGQAFDAYGAYYPYFYAVPYGIDLNDDSPSDDNAQDDAPYDDPDYQGGPTVFDRRGYGEDSYIPPPYTGPAHQIASSDYQTQAQTQAETSQPAGDVSAESPQPSTTLVFKDGRRLEVANYAIVSQTLYDLTPGHRRKIALAELDLPATEKENDEHGVIFLLPSLAQAN